MGTRDGDASNLTMMKTLPMMRIFASSCLVLLVFIVQDASCVLKVTLIVTFVCILQSLR
jgi:hypothetical protein